MKHYTSLPNPSYFSESSQLLGSCIQAIKYDIFFPRCRFEDGTVPFLDIIAVNHGFETLYRITGAARECAHLLKSIKPLIYELSHDAYTSC